MTCVHFYNENDSSYMRYKLYAVWYANNCLVVLCSQIV